MNNSDNKSFNSKFESRRLKLYILIAFFLLLWGVGAAVISGYIISSSEKNFREVSSVKLEKEKKEIYDLYNKYQSELSGSAKSINENKNFTKSVSASDNKKVFEELLRSSSENIQSEVYNKRLELIAFNGRQQNPTIVQLQKALSGSSFSLVKESGFYSNLTLFSPIKDPANNYIVTGVLVTSRILDLKYSIQNKFFTSKGFTGELKDLDDLNIEIIPADNALNEITLDSNKLKSNSILELKGIDDKVIAKVLIPEYSKDNYIDSINNLKEKNFTLIIFIISLLLIEALFHYTKLIDSDGLRFDVLAIALIGLRYLWLFSGFPNKFISSELFSPSYYASAFGFGLSKSAGDLFITSVFVLAIAVNYFIIVFNSNNDTTDRSKRILLVGIFTVISFSILYLYGQVIQSIIFDSNLKFFDRTKIIPNVEVVVILLIVIIFSISVYLILSASVFGVVKQLKHLFAHGVHTLAGVLRKYLILFLFIIFILIDLLLSLIIPLQVLNFYQSGLIVTLVFIFVYYIYSVKILKRRHVVFKFKELSFLILLVIITVPYILFDKISVQETKYVELLGDKIAENVDDKINYLISSELAKFGDNRTLEFSLKNNSKVQKLAFSLWADSKLSSEDLNSAVIILDTNKNMVSDFNINSLRLNSDSIISFYKSVSRVKERKNLIPDSLLVPAGDEAAIDEEPDFNGMDFSNIQSPDSLSSYKIDIYKNNNEKYYLGIVDLEDINLRSTQFERKLGYGIIAIQYEPKNFLIKSSLEIFRNYSRDNLMDKLLSSPVISEYVNEELINTNDPSYSGVSVNSLRSFTEYIKPYPVKRTWRYETINNEKYRTYFIQVPDNENEGGADKIYTISLRRNDFNIITFFYLKFILFCAAIYLIVSFLYLLIYIPQINIFKINFREKLFAAFFIVSVIPIISLALYTRSYINNKYDQTFANQIKSDLNLLSEGVKTKSFDLSLNKKFDSLSVQPKNILNKNFSQIDKNFNIFIKNKLVSTTNEELFQSGLIDERIDGSAFYNIFYEKKDLVLRNEDIGGFSFIVGYKPMLDRNNNLLGIISSQSVYRQNEVNEELTESLTFIFGIYVIAIILLLILVIFLTERISRPLSELKLATDRISKGESNVEIRNTGMDEFKTLVDSFNQMSAELERSKVELKKAERESAWRDIARRVAHEIKNPLTPMKLSVQHAYDVFKNEDAKAFAKVLEKTKDIMLKEIDKLNKIATEFSNFAKLPERNYELLNINNILDDVISLYDTAPNVDFEITKDEKLPMITGDKQEINRVFQNIIKNSIQAIDPNSRGLIKAVTYQTKDCICIEISDNGVGIDKDIMDKLFEPDFSTKSTGMGLGLSIAKKSLDMMKAEIKYESIKDKGTTALISFKKSFNGK